MPGWLSKIGQAAGKAASSVTDSLVEQVQSELGNVDLGPLVDKIRNRATTAQQAAQETMEICTQTNEKRQAMMDFGKTILATIQSLKEGENGAEILETIKDLTDGDKVQEAKALAEGLDDAALQCVDKSIAMIDIMEDTMDSLPSFVQSAIENATPDAQDEDDDIDLLKDIDKDVEDVVACVTAVQNLNLVSAMELGLQAFSQLTDKAERSRSMFQSIYDYASNVDDLSNALRSSDVRSIVSEAKDMLQCIHLSETMRMVAEGARKLLQVLIQLFEVIAQRISKLWSSLAIAKDCMVESLSQVTAAKQLCGDAHERGAAILEKTRAIKDQMESVTDLNAESVRALKELSTGEDIQESIELARNMDDMIVNCKDNMMSMIDRVSAAFGEFPDILTDGIDLVQTGKDDNDPDPVDVEDDINELEEARQAIEESNLLASVSKTRAGFDGVTSKVDLCESLLQRMDGFTRNCETSIDSFVKVWDIESVMTKIADMGRLVNLGELMRQFAEQMTRLLQSIIALLKSVVEKFKNSSLEEIGGDLVENAADAIDDAVDLVKNKFNIFGR